MFSHHVCYVFLALSYTPLCVFPVMSCHPQMSLTDHSYQFHATYNEDHMITTTSNCGPRQITTFPASHDQHQQHSWRRGYIGVMQALCEVQLKSRNPYK